MSKTKHSRSIYEDVLAKIVEAGVFSDAERARAGYTLADKTRSDVAKGAKLDWRPPFLMAVSGKGGWVSDEREFAARKSFTNVTLLDHVLSVVRGALVFAEVDLAYANLSDEEFRKRLSLIAAVAFLHDIDKMLGLSRVERIRVEHVAKAVEMYRIDEFLSGYSVRTSTSSLLSMIEAVEVGRADVLAPGRQILPQEIVRDCGYIRLADRLEGLFLDSQRGIDWVLSELASTKVFRSHDFAREWRALTLASPHTPFILEELLGAVSSQCEAICDHPPLFEIHHDGILVSLLPAGEFDRIVAGAIEEIAGKFGGSMRIVNNNKGARSIHDARGGAEDLFGVVHGDHFGIKDAETSLRAHLSVVEAHASDILDLLAPYGIAPKWPNLAKVGKLVPVFAGVEENDPIGLLLKDAAALAVALSFDPETKLSVPSRAQREKELVQVFGRRGYEVPQWLQSLDDNVGRSSLLAVYAVAVWERDADIEQEIRGEGGLVDGWLLGSQDRSGLTSSIEEAGSLLGGAVRDYLRAASLFEHVPASNENADGRCHFTNMPVDRANRIDTGTGLYGLNVSAFSGREGRPEWHDKPEAETLVSPLAQAEHRLRADRASRKKADVPVCISSPTTSGLFASLILSPDADFLALTDVLRLDRSAGKVTSTPLDALVRRKRIARYEDMPTRFGTNGDKPGQLDFVRRVMESARRMGRPIHVFRGIPVPESAFVYFDFLPLSIEKMLGGRAFRLGCGLISKQARCGSQPA